MPKHNRQTDSRRGEWVFTIICVLCAFVLVATTYSLLWDLALGAHFPSLKTWAAGMLHWAHDLPLFILTALTLAAALPLFRRLDFVRSATPAPTRTENPLPAIINNTAEGIVVINGEGVIEVFNPAAEQIFGYAQNEVLGHNVSVLLPETERAHHQSYVDNSKLHESRIIDRTRDLEGQKKDGTRFPLSLNVTRIDTSEKRFVAFIRDITLRKKRERELEQARLRAESANISKATFLASMSHEFRTPLNAIIGFGDFLEHGHAGELTEKQREYIALMLSSGQHLLSLVSDVLEMSQIEAGITVTEPQEIEVPDAIDDVLHFVRGRATQMDIRIENACSNHARRMWADPVRFRQVMINLLSNAIKYNHAGGWIKIECEETPDEMIRISVTDSGSGIPMDKQHGMFEPFNRMGREAGNIEGTGIGLTITKDLMDIMNGRIDFLSTEGVGSTFWIELPIAAMETA